jgi:arylformamidase
LIPKVNQVLDLTQPLYNNCPSIAAPLPPQITLIRNAVDHGWTLEQLTMTTHQGTHMDAPYHLEGFKLTIDLYPPECFQGIGVIIDLRYKKALEAINPEDLEPYSSKIVSDSIIILGTGWGEKRSWTRNWALQSPRLSPEGAKWLVERKIRGVGIDHYSIGGMVEENEITHRSLLEANIWIIEDLRLPEGLFVDKAWHIFALPLLLQGCSGAPCRAIAVSYEGSNS